VSDPQRQQLLVNLRPHVVEVHLPDRVITVGPMASVPVTETSPQVHELVRRGLLALRDQDEEPEADDEPTGEDSDVTAVPEPPAKRTGRARGSAPTTRGGN
jgi:hypothetical protein